MRRNNGLTDEQTMVMVRISSPFSPVLARLSDASRVVKCDPVKHAQESFTRTLNLYRPTSRLVH